MNSLLLIRHGESEHHLGELTGGWTDTPLTERGRHQVTLLAARLKTELQGVPARIFCSDLQRAVQTAEIVGQELGLRLGLAPPLREFNNGVAAGKTQAEAEELFTPPTEPLLDWRPYPQAETWREFFHRVAAFVRNLTQNQDSLLLLVTHGGTIISIVTWWLQLPIDSLSHIFFDIAPASITVLRVNKWNDRTIERMNDTAHLYAAGLAERITF